MSTESSTANTANPVDRIDQEALEWVTRRISGLNATDERDFRRWLEGDAARREAFLRWQQDWNSLDAAPAEALDVLRQNLEHDKRLAQSEAFRPSRKPAARSCWSRWSNWWPHAAMAALLIAVLAGGWQAFDFWQQSPVFSQAWNTNRGQLMNVRLPDGSELQLDTATRVAAVFYRNRREVELPEGEVMFHVQGDSGRPFDVIAGPLRVTVVGTRFSVRHAAATGPNGAQGVRIAVEEGRVRVARRARPGREAGEMGSGDQRLELTSGQQVFADALGVLGPVGSVPTAGIASWRQGRVSFNDVPLAEALAEFERYGSTGLQVRDPAVAALRLTGTFELRRPDRFARVLPQVLPVRLVNRGGNTEISVAEGD